MKSHKEVDKGETTTTSTTSRLLTPRRPGEPLYVQETLLRKRRQQNLRLNKDKDYNLGEIQKQRKRNEHREEVVTLGQLLRSSLASIADHKRVNKIVRRRRQLVARHYSGSIRQGRGAVIRVVSPLVSSAAASSSPPGGGGQVFLSIPKSHVNVIRQIIREEEFLDPTKHRIQENTTTESTTTTTSTLSKGKSVEQLQNEHQEYQIRVDYAVATRRVLLVVRNAAKHPSKPTIKALATLNLSRPFSAVFVPVDGAHCEMLNLIHPFVMYGFPTKQTIRNLFTRRAVFKVRNHEPSRPKDTVATTSVNTDYRASLVSGELAPAPRPLKPLSMAPLWYALTDNVIVEQRLGHLGLLCVDDLVHEVWSCGPAFQALKAEMGVFRLCHMKTVEGVFYRNKCFGNFDASINLLVEKLI